MEASFWLERWAQRQIGFHQADVHADLLRFGDRFLAGGPHRILVPLCGKTVDLAHLAGLGHEVVGVELSEDAVRELFSEAGLAPEVTTEGAYRAYRGAGLTVLAGDVFALASGSHGTFDRVWDRAVLVALDPARRARYARLLTDLVRPGGVMLLNAFRYTGHKPGPPHSVPEHELAAHYRDAFRMELLDASDRIDQEARWREAGITEWAESTWWLERR
jgi:thiopurine S-methyltransferase